MRRKLLAPLISVILLLSALTLTLVSADGSDDRQIETSYTYYGNGGVVVTGSSEGYTYITTPTPFDLPFELDGVSEGVSGTIENATLYLCAVDYTSNLNSWTVDLTDSLGWVTNLFTGTSIPYSGDLGFELFRFDVTSLLDGLGEYVNGYYQVRVTKGGGYGFGVFGAALVVVYSDPSSPPVYVWINDGCEYIKGEYATPVTTSTDFLDQGQPPFGGISATLHTIVGGGEAGGSNEDDKVYFDTILLATGAFDASNRDMFDIDNFDVFPYMGPGPHSATFSSYVDGYIVYSAILSYNPRSAAVIPEVPYGTIVTMTLLLLGFALYIKRPFLTS